MMAIATPAANSTPSDRFRALSHDHESDPIRPDRFIIGVGTFDDYAQLAHHHYKAGPPGTATRVFTVHDPADQCVVSRFRLAGVATHSQAQAHPTLIGVLVVSYPSLACQLRDVATHKRYINLSTQARAAMLNREVRVISRVIVDPRYRGLGLAVRLVRHALAQSETVYTEAIAAMGRINPFFARAGMTTYRRPMRAEQVRLRTVLEELDIPPTTVAKAGLFRARMNSLSPPNLDWLRFEIRHFAGVSLRLTAHKRDRLTFEECVRITQSRLFNQPTYYLFRRKDGSS